MCHRFFLVLFFLQDRKGENKGMGADGTDPLGDRGDRDFVDRLWTVLQKNKNQLKQQTITTIRKTIKSSKYLITQNEKIPMTKSWKIKNKAKTKEAVWESLRTGIEPEKKL